MKKVFTIRITDSANHPAIWYANKAGREYQAELGVNSDKKIVYRIDGILYVHPEDCIITGETVIEQYLKY